MLSQAQLVVHTPGRGTTEITGRVDAVVAQSGVQRGLCHLFIHHTSASLILCENADPSVRRDLEAFMARLVPDGDSRYEHRSEGADDMAAHLRSVLTQSALTLPVHAARCDLGAWQGLYVWEHRHTAHDRRITVTVLGEAGSP